MEPQQQQQQQYNYQYQYQQQQQQTTLTTPSYDPVQQQLYDQQSTYYTSSYPQQTQQEYDYSSYYYQQQQQQQQQEYATSYQPNDPNLVHPPGVPVPVVDSNQSHVYNAQSYYYPPGVLPSQHGYMPAGGHQAGQPARGRGTFGRGRGRGGGRGKPAKSSGPSAPGGASSSVVGQAASSKPASRMAWCEVCRTDCTTFEVLEQHKNGKRHKKNLKVQAELLGLGRQLIVSNPETVPTQNAEVSNASNLPNDNIGPEPAPLENKTDNPETTESLPSQESIRKDQLAGRGGFKRKMRGGRGGKWMRALDGSRRPVEPPKPKQVVPLICELCNVKCESQVVFESHITGKKHIANMKRFQDHKEVLGEGIQALYPSISHLLPSTSIISQPNQQQGLQDAQALASMMLSQQNLQDPQAAQEALTQLLHQHGIHDAQTLMAQLIPYLLTQIPGSLPAQEAGVGIPAQNPVSQGAPVPAASESLHATVENQTEQQAPTANDDSEVDPGTNDKPLNFSSEGQP